MSVHPPTLCPPFSKPCLKWKNGGQSVLDEMSWKNGWYTQFSYRIMSKAYYSDLAAQYLNGKQISNDVLDSLMEQYAGQFLRTLHPKFDMTLDQKEAFLQRVFPGSASNAEQLFMRCTDCKEFSTIINKKSSRNLQIRVASFGCGPGSEVVGFLRFLQKYNAKCPLILFLFDIQDWSEMVQFTVSRSSADAKLYASCCFQQANVLEQSFIDSIPSRKCLVDCDIFLFSKFACEIEAQRQQCLKFYEALFSLAKQNSFVLAIDLGYESRYAEALMTMERQSLNNGFRCLRTSFDTANENGGTGDYDKELLSQSRTGKPTAFRFLTKSIDSESIQLTPTWKRPGASFQLTHRETRHDFEPYFQQQNSTVS